MSWNDNNEILFKSNIGLIYLYSDNNSNTLEVNALVAYPIHSFIMNLSFVQIQYHIDNRHKVVGFLSVGADVGGFRNNMDHHIEPIDVDASYSDVFVPLDDYTHPEGMGHDGRKR